MGGLWWSPTKYCKDAWGRRELLVRWKGAPPAKSSWVELDEFKRRFTEFQLEDELGERDVMYSEHV
jgi:hypothetical protein